MTFFRYCFVVFLLIFSALSKSEIVNKIEIIGLDSISRGTILNYLPLEVGDNLDSSDIPQVKKVLLSTDLFSDLQINLKNNTLVIKLTENPTIKYFEVIGYEEDEIFSVSSFEELQKNFDLSVGKIFLKKNLDTLVNQINNLYQTNGYYGANTSTLIDVDSKNRVGIKLSISEGDRAKIGSFKISGNSYFETNDLKDLFEIGEPDFFILNYFTERDNFSLKSFEAGLESINTKYNSEGFLDIKIIKSSVLLNSKNNLLDVDIVIDEGQQYKVGDLTFNGDIFNIDDKKMKQFFNVSRGDIFKRNKVIRGLQEVELLYQNKGYAYVKVDLNALKSPEKSNYIDINISITPDSRMYLSRIDIVGNNRTQDSVIRRTLSINEGERYSRDQIDNSISRIKRLGYFSSVKHEIRRRLYDSDKVDLFIEVVETKTGEISIGLSQSNATGSAVNFGISQNNILGTGNILNATLTNSSAVDELSFYFKNPYINNSGHSLSYGFVNKKLDASDLDASAYVFDENSFILGYGIPVSELSNIFSELKISSLDLSCGSDLLVYEQSDCTSNDKYDLSMNITYLSNSLNDTFFPSSGSAIRISNVLAFPLGDFQYNKFEASTRNYSPIFNDKTLKLATRFNYATGYGGKELPFFKRYYEGGSSSVRGFNFNSLGSVYSNDKPKGGEVSIISSASIASKADMIGLDNENIRVIGFIDAGTIAEKTSDFSFSDLRSSVGLQLSWLTPIGPIGLSAAKPLIKKSEDKTETLSFELGAKF